MSKANEGIGLRAALAAGKAEVDPLKEAQAKLIREMGIKPRRS